MPVKLHTLISALLPPTRGIRLLEVSIGDKSVRLQFTVAAPTAACPCCAVSSSSVHSRYRCIGLLVTLTLAILLAPFPAEAQPPPTVHRIGLLRTGTASAEQPFLESIRQGLHDLGYVEGQNLIIEPRQAEGSDERLRRLVATAMPRCSGGPPRI